ncbi:hypothetical protein KR044_003428, partial [Drosophila immigrans]
RLAKHLQKPQLAAKGQEEEFLSNPMNSLSLIRQMNADWSYVEQLMQQPVGQKQMDFMRQTNEQRPQLENVEEALVAMHRIKESYKLNATDIANGLLDGLQTDAKLSPLDCYEMGLLYYNGSRYAHAVEWFKTAREVMDQNPNDVYVLLGLKRSKISYMLARAYTALGKAISTFNYFKNIIVLMLLGDLQPGRLVLQTEPEFSSRVEQLLDYFQKNTPEAHVNEQLIDFYGEFAHLCGSSYKPKPSRLLCSYKTSPTPFLRLAPFKMEQILMDPEIYVFHDVISSTEIATLERETEAFLEPARVQIEGKKVISSIRTVRSVWLPDTNLSSQVNLLAERIQRRISDLSDMRTGPMYPAEMLKYGFGGHYSIHCDFLNNSELFKDDRVATVLLYLNDVPSGGGTMFIEHSLTVQPELGKALLWYNLRTDTFDFDLRSAHASCPVKIGNKLVMTQWIHEQDQMFIRPCLQPPISRQY